MSEPSPSHLADSEKRRGEHAAGTTAVLSLALKAVFICICIAVLSLLAATRLLHPLEGDGALFLTAAKMIGDGAVLYVDFWDVKQPGIYYFYWLAGIAFGFTFEGVHLLQVVYWAIVGALMFFLVRPYLVHSWIAIVAPLAFLGTYFAHARIAYLAQVEIIANGPLLLSAVLLAATADSAGASRNCRLVLAGIFGALVVLLKLALAPILFAFFLVHSAICFSKQTAISTIARDAFFVFLGGASVLLAVAFALYWDGGLNGAIEASFQVGPDWALNAPEAPFSRLILGARSISVSFAAWAGFALIGLACAWSPKQRPLNLQCMAWIGAALFCILIQRFSWWPYHWQLLYLPFALFAMLGADCALDWLGRRLALGEGAKVAIAIVAFVPALFGYTQVVADRVLLLQEHEEEISRSDFDGFRVSVSEVYADAIEIAAALSANAEPGSIYVMGDPLVYVVTGKEQAVPVHGWSLELFSPLIWARLVRELMTERPEAIFVASYYKPLLNAKAPVIRDFLDSNYILGPKLSHGDWYLLKQAREDG